LFNDGNVYSGTRTLGSSDGGPMIMTFQMVNCIPDGDLLTLDNPDDGVRLLKLAGWREKLNDSNYRRQQSTQPYFMRLLPLSVYVHEASTHAR
jgi:hypothetical protein